MNQGGDVPAGGGALALIFLSAGCACHVVGAGVGVETNSLLEAGLQGVLCLLELSLSSEGRPRTIIILLPLPLLSKNFLGD